MQGAIPFIGKGKNASLGACAAHTAFPLTLSR